MEPGKARWLALTLPALLGLDFATKQWARGLDVGEQVYLSGGWLSLTHVENPFVAFSLPVPLPLVVAVGLAAVAVISWTWLRLPANARLASAALGVLGAGVLGNLVDRLHDGTVTDMVRMGWWPVFNVADVALIAGMGLWIAAEGVQRRVAVREACSVVGDRRRVPLDPPYGSAVMEMVPKRLSWRT